MQIGSLIETKVLRRLFRWKNNELRWECRKLRNVNSEGQKISLKAEKLLTALDAMSRLVVSYTCSTDDEHKIHREFWLGNILERNHTNTEK